MNQVITSGQTLATVPDTPVPAKSGRGTVLRCSEVGTRYVVLLLALLLTACASSTSHPHASAHESPSFSVHDATVKACKALLAWENGNSSQTFDNDPNGSAVVENDAENTPMEADVQMWVSDLDNSDTSQAPLDADKVGADCGAVGIPIFGSGSS